MNSEFRSGVAKPKSENYQARTARPSRKTEPWDRAVEQSREP